MKILFSFYDRLGYLVDTEIVYNKADLDWQSIDEIGYDFVDKNDDYDSFTWGIEP